MCGNFDGDVSILIILLFIATILDPPGSARLAGDVGMSAARYILVDPKLRSILGPLYARLFELSPF